jgi:glycosyltransferase involved in cell wall biosynthesis
MPIPSPAPIIAIVLPLFRHSVLVVDALESAIAQRSRYPFTVIVVNDGCPFRESDAQVKSIRALYPDLVQYVVQPNRGLSAARNTGIDYALGKFPSVQAIYFMDADNVILPGAIDAAYSKLSQEPETSWVYPNIDMFGVRKNFDYGGPYSLLMHTQQNICEAGSLVHRRVFDAGIRFDENMKLGYEDWDFWLTSAGCGFRGAPLPHFGFRYRNRGESMLSQAHRDDGEIRAYMQKKHPSLLSRRSLLHLEAMEAPRYAIVLLDKDEVLLTTGHSDSLTVLSQAEFAERLWRNLIIPSRQYIPPFFAMTTRAIFEGLSRLGLLLSVLHESEEALKGNNITCLVIAPVPGNAVEVKPGGRAHDSDVVVLGRDVISKVIRDRDTAWIERLISPDDQMNVSTRTVTVPQRAGYAAPPRGTVAFLFLSRILSWRDSPYRAAAERSWVWREFSIPPPHALYFHVRVAFGGEVAYPRPLGDARNIGFVLPVASFGGVERIAYNLAEQFTRAGWRAHLFVIGRTRLELPDEFAKSFATINMLDDPAFLGSDPAANYQGTFLPAARNSPRAINRMVAALAWLDAVVNCHSSEFNAASANLRQLGIKTAAELQLLDLTPLGRSLGHPLLTLAYEHAYDLILCNSQQLISWMHAAGVPWEKLVLMPNAPGHALEAVTRERILARRRLSSHRGLNALYLGRLDRQKGMERLAEVVKQTRELELPIHWRIVGSHVIEYGPVPPILQELLEPAVFESEQLTSLLDWADVMVLLSDYEGVPLVVLEAQRLGVVVIATDVGALAEIISPGTTGFLVGRETAVEETVSLLGLLAETPSLRCAVAAAASSQVMAWPQAAAEAIRRISALVEDERHRTSGRNAPSAPAPEFR